MSEPEHKTITPEALDRLTAKLADWATPKDPVDAFAGKHFTHHGNGPRKHAAYAHFPGTGPQGTYCGACAHVRKRKLKSGAVALCAQWRRLQPKGDWTPIDHRSESCRYFEARQGLVQDEAS